MHIVVYTHPDGHAFHRLNQALASVDLDRPPAVHSDVDQFCACFRSVSSRPDVVIIMPERSEELDALAEIRDLFEDRRTVVILPERESGTVSKGHRFHPRFITFDDGDFTEVAAVLQHFKRSLCPCANPDRQWRAIV